MIDIEVDDPLAVSSSQLPVDIVSPATKPPTMGSENVCLGIQVVFPPRETLPKGCGHCSCLIGCGDSSGDCETTIAGENQLKLKGNSFQTRIFSRINQIKPSETQLDSPSKPSPAELPTVAVEDRSYVYDVYESVQGIAVKCNLFALILLLLY